MERRADPCNNFSVFFKKNVLTLEKKKNTIVPARIYTSSQQFMKVDEEPDEKKEDIPAYCVGKPYGGKKVCYLGYDSAYEKTE